MRCGQRLRGKEVCKKGGGGRKSRADQKFKPPESRRTSLVEEGKKAHSVPSSGERPLQTEKKKKERTTPEKPRSARLQKGANNKKKQDKCMVGSRPELGAAQKQYDTLPKKLEGWTTIQIKKRGKK